MEISRNTRRQASIVCCALTGWQRWPALCEIPCCSSRSMRRLTTRRSKARHIPRTAHQTVRRALPDGLGHVVQPAAGSSVTKLENTIRLIRQAGDLAIWNNRATQYHAVADYDDQYRRLNRVTLSGDMPIDVHGPHSRAVVGDVNRFRRWSVPSRWRADYSRSISRDINAVSSQTCRLG